MTGGAGFDSELERRNAGEQMGTSVWGRGIAPQSGDTFGGIVPTPVSELVIGMVGPLGVDLDSLTEALNDALSLFSYRTELIRLSRLITDFLRPTTSIPESPWDDRQKALMDAGDNLRSKFGRAEIVASLAVAFITQSRPDLVQDSPNTPIAYILRSLKNPKEAEILRNIYGRNFLLIAAYAPKVSRLDYVTEQIAISRNQAPGSAHRSSAENLIERDEKDSEKGSDLKQNVRDTFPWADIFVDVTDKEQTRKSITRFIELILGYPYHSPSPEEYAMFMAHAAALRSADLSRQVGAAITTAEGDVVALGTNEVPKAGGGQYWGVEPDDKRDFQRGYDANALHKRFIVAEALNRL